MIFRTELLVKHIVVNKDSVFIKLVIDFIHTPLIANGMAKSARHRRNSIAFYWPFRCYTARRVTNHENIYHYVVKERSA